MTWTLPRTLAIVPTFQERDNLPGLLQRLHTAADHVDVLVVDDASPDGTGELAEELAAADPRVHVLHREAKTGLGAAYVAGFRWALRRDYGVVVEMDADGSHAPEELHRLFAALPEADVVLGSRYVPGGEVRNWPWYREWLSRGANGYSRVLLGLHIRDVTGGYRAYRRAVLSSVSLDDVQSQGYCFQVDLAIRALRAGFRVEEVPITFTERTAGRSKMDGSVLREALWRISRWGVECRLGTGPWGAGGGRSGHDKAAEG